MTSTQTLHRLTGRLVTGALTLAVAGATLAVAPPAEAHHGDLPSGRTLTRHTVRAGETATELAVRYHAWTAELIRYNHLGSDATLYVGQKLVIPQVTARMDPKPAKKRPATTAKKSTGSKKPKATAATWKHADPSRATVRSAITRTAKRHGVDPELALAISWQESGWQMHHVSWASAIGAMQVLPTTGTWMSLYAGRPLRLTTLSDNVLAGVLLLDVLDDNTRSQTHQIAAYYQGLGAVREHGLYRETRAYVANVRAIKKRLERGWHPE
jgi:LysM repeat protein